MTLSVIFEVLLSKLGDWEHLKGGFLAQTDKQIRVSIVVSIPACHAGDPGSIPGRGAFFSTIRYTLNMLIKCNLKFDISQLI